MGPRLGIVGLGEMGNSHGKNAVTHGATIVAGADIDAAARESFAADYDAVTYEGHEAMYEMEDLDAVVITTPNAFHESASTAALERGIDVLCEKPLAASLPGAERIADAAAESEAFCMVGFHKRFSTAGVLFEQRHASGHFGEIRHIEANYVRRRGIPDLGSWFTNADLSGGGALIDIGVHAIDFALYLAGFPTVEEVSGVTHADFGGREDYADPDNWTKNQTRERITFDVEDSANAFIRCANDTTIALDVAWATNRESTTKCVVRGTEAGAYCLLDGDSLLVYETGTGGADHYADTRLTSDLEPSRHEAEMVAFLAGVETGEAPEENTVEQGLIVQRVVDAIYRSSERGEAVRVVR